MIPAFFCGELRAWLLGDMITELRLLSLEFASLVGPLRDATTGGILNWLRRRYAVLCRLHTDILRWYRLYLPQVVI